MVNIEFPITIYQSCPTGANHGMVGFFGASFFSERAFTKIYLGIFTKKEIPNFHGDSASLHNSFVSLAAALKSMAIVLTPHVLGKLAVAFT
jgi:hypothetical protein